MLSVPPSVTVPLLDGIGVAAAAPLPSPATHPLRSRVVATAVATRATSTAGLFFRMGGTPLFGCWGHGAQVDRAVIARLVVDVGFGPHGVRPAMPIDADRVEQFDPQIGEL